ncbi:MAG: acetyl/propionyl/methylcrotonyl-CoA carboxylase subunit alpha [Rhodobacteraceae bacterium]|nr:acetyl/propionyl/methylcrotonyl-CoA carboxylase subunit alpha [Paracoccaceae bacterium]
MFSKILIANRGEIACRIIETAHKMGVLTVAVYSDADRDAKHVAMADEAVHLGPPAVNESYLLGERVVEAALNTGAEAIHPGYGFLSENPEFVEMVEAAGLVFIGPSVSAIRAMGLKDAAKKLMEEAGVPVVPGYHGDNQDDGFLATKAEEIGYPVLIKAVAGGGGKGMRRVDHSADFAELLHAARRESSASFGNDQVLIEKYILSPRHIEIQVFGDNHGEAVHLFERDCSLQRRHQKVIEEAPAPGMTEEMRAAMGAAAVKAAKAIGYSGAGTVEFIVDGADGLRADGFWFMEMNTRLQVEHPVSEMITGVDIVAWQLQVAAGEALPARQEDLRINGHAFEARIYAEDVAAGFLPATGRLEVLDFPADVRIDSGVRAGDEISPYYDPMIAKLTVWGKNRTEALGRLHRALSNTDIIGCTTNVDFLAALAANEAFGRGDVDTGLIERDLAELIALPAPSAMVKALAAIAARDWGSGFTLWAPLCQSVGLEGEVLPVLVLGKERYLVDGLAVNVLLRDGPDWRVEIGGRIYQARVWRLGGQVHVRLPGMRLSVLVDDPLEAGGNEAADASDLYAPMPGLVSAIMAAAGDEVEAGAPLLVMEAMKMEHTLRAPFTGVVAEVLAVAGAQVESGALLLRMEAP